MGFLSLLTVLNLEWLSLLESQIAEVIAFFLWILARFTHLLPDNNFSNMRILVADYVYLNLLPQIHMFANHENKRIRELARFILENIGDKEFASHLKMSSWIKSLDIPSPQVEDTIRKLFPQDLELHYLLSPEIAIKIISLQTTSYK